MKNKKYSSFFKKYMFIILNLLKIAMKFKKFIADIVLKKDFLASYGK